MADQVLKAAIWAGLRALRARRGEGLLVLILRQIGGGGSGGLRVWVVLLDGGNEALSEEGKKNQDWCFDKACVKGRRPFIRGLGSR